MSKPLTIAVGVPCYNAERFVESVVASVLRQTRKPDAVYVVDDGSTDRTATLAERIEGVTLLRHEGNKGLATARNTMIEACECDILLMIDSDAHADSRLIETLLNEYTSPEIAGVGGKAVESHRQTPADRWRGLHQFAQHWGDEAQGDVPFIYGIICSYRTEVLREAGGFDLDHLTNGEDVEMGSRLRNRGYRLAYTPQALVYHKRRDDFSSLMRMVYRYCKGGLEGMLRNNEGGLMFGIITGLRHLKRNLQRDARELPDPRQGMISIAAYVAEMSGYIAALRSARKPYSRFEQP